MHNKKLKFKPGDLLCMRNPSCTYDLSFYRHPNSRNKLDDKDIVTVKDDGTLVLVVLGYDRIDDICIMVLTSSTSSSETTATVITENYSWVEASCEVPLQAALCPASAA